jgi:hypothetical protein
MRPDQDFRDVLAGEFDDVVRHLKAHSSLFFALSGFVFSMCSTVTGSVFRFCTGPAYRGLRTRESRP